MPSSDRTGLPSGNRCTGAEQTEEHISDTDAMGATLHRPRNECLSAIGKYEIRRELGCGGQATVFLAWDPDLGRHVVLKHYHWTDTAEDIQRVLEEGRALARIDSPFVARCFGAERFGERPYLIIEYIAGKSLHDEHRQQPRPIRESVRLIRQCVEGVCAIHARGLLHRDLKPANILIDDSGQPHIIDFGLAAPLASRSLESLSGTLAYMAPEQAREEYEHIDFRSDLFGIGGVLYFMLCGHAPHEAKDVTALIELARAGEVVPVRERNRAVPAPLADLCDRCLALDRARRPESARQLARELDLFLESTGRHRRRVTFGCAALLLGALIMLSIWAPWRNRGSGPPDAHDAAISPVPELTHHPDGRLLRRDFPLSVEFVGARPDSSGWLRLQDGDVIALRISPARNCYVRVWSVQPDTVLQVYPNSAEQDRKWLAGEMRLVPGRSTEPGAAAQQLRARRSTGFEYLHVLAATTPFTYNEGQQFGNYAIFDNEERPAWQYQLRGFVLEKRPDDAADSLQVAEAVIPFQVGETTEANQR